MPDFQQQPQILPPLPQTQDTIPASGSSAPQQTPLDRVNNAINNVQQNLPDWVNSNFVTPYKTRLDQTLRYSDPNIGYNPLDSDLEDKYAKAHYLKTFGNNILQGGARFLGTAAETIATIPLAVDAIANKDFSKLYDNDLTNGIHSWLNSLDTLLPVYQTNFERDHPILKYLDPLNPKAFLGAVGGAFNNFGFTAGAIAGAMVEDAAITAITGGAGFFPALAANGAQLTKMLGRAGRAVTATAEGITDAKTALRAGEAAISDAASTGREVSTTLRNNVGEGLQDVGHNINSQQLANADEVLARDKVQEIKQAIKNNANYYKIRDAVKYNLALLTSATSEAAFEAVDVYHRGLDQLKQQYFDQYGTTPYGSDLDNIKRISHQSANVDMAGNIAFLYMMNRVNWGSLFKPTTQAFDEAITGWGGSIARSQVQKDAESAAGSQLYKVVNKTPETKIGKILLNGEKIYKIGFRSINEAVEEGTQFIMSEGAMDYNLRKYKAEQRGQVVDGWKSFLAGVDKTFNTNEGWDNMMGGFVGGIFGSAVTERILSGRGQVNAKDQMAIQAKLLNQYNFNGTFENKVQEAAIQTSLAEEHKTAVENQDTFAAKNIKMQMLFNWVVSGIKANSFDKRIEELDAVRSLEGKSFQDYWGKEDNEKNRTEINDFLDNIEEEASNIKSHYTRIDRLTKNPFERNTIDYEAYDSYKDQLALNLSLSDNYVSRINKMQEELRQDSPLFDIQKAINLTSINGLRNTLEGIDKAQVELQNQINTAKETKSDPELITNLTNKHKALTKLFKQLQPLVINSKTGEETNNVTESAFNGKDYVDVLQKLYELHDGSSFLNNKYINKFEKPNIIVDEQGAAHVISHDKLAENLQTLQDIYKLSTANLNVQRFYNFLRKGVGATDFMEKLKAVSLEDLQKYVSKEDGQIKTPDEIHNEIEEEARFETPEPTNMEEASKEERDIIRQAAKKVVSGDALTEDEEKLSIEKPNRFAHEVKVQEKTEQRYTERFTPSTTETEIKPTPRAKIRVRDLFGMYSQDNNQVKNRTNLYNAIFKSKNIFDNLTASFSIPEIKGDVTFSWIPNTQLYRSLFKENITIFHNNEPIGILRPQDSVWLDDEGKRSIYDMTKEEFTAITGHPEEQYDSFMKELRAYQTAYNNFKEALQKNPNTKLTIDDINKFFDLSINTGAVVQNRYVITQAAHNFNVVNPNGGFERQFSTLLQAQTWISQNNNTLSRFDTLLKDLNYKPQGTALISFVDQVVLGQKQTARNLEPAIVNKDDLTEEQQSQILAFLETNKKDIQSNVQRYAILLPINGEYQLKGMVFARNANTTQEEHTEFFNRIKSVANGLENDLNKTSTELNEKFFIANQDRTIKQTFITVAFSDNGDLLLNINNPSLKVFKTIQINKETVQGVNSYGDLIKLFQEQINNESQKHKGFAKLQVQLNEDSLKRQIPSDEEVTKLSQVETKLRLATTPDVFTNYNINFLPKGYGAEQKITPEQQKPQPPAPTNVDEETKMAQQAINEEYLKKRQELNNEFTNSLTDAEKRIREVLVKNPALATDKPNLLKQANATDNELLSYSKKAARYNEQFRIYNQIQQQKLANPTKTDVAIYAKTKAGIEIIAKDLFNLSNEEANAVAEIFDANAQAWASRTGNSVADYYKQLGFKSRLEEDINSPNILEQYPAIQKVIDYLKLKPKRISINKIGYVSENGSVGINLANRVGEVIKQQNLQDLVGARWNKTDNAIEFFPIDRQGTLFQIAGIEGIKNINPKLLSENLASAEEFEKDGEDPKLIYALTGWERGKDGKWRYDLNDKFTFKPKALDTLSKEGSVKLKDLINNPTLFKAYPYLEDLSVLKSFNTDGYAHTVNSILLRKANFEDLQLSEFPEANNQLYTTLVHEIQHAIQAIEGFERGGNTKAFEKENNEIFLQLQKFEHERNKLIYIDNLNHDSKNEDKITNLSNQINKLTESITGSNNSPFGKYYRLAGEVEARNAQMRYSFSPELSRNTPISKTEGISRDDQIIGKSIVAISKNEDNNVLFQNDNKYSFNFLTDDKFKAYEGKTVSKETISNLLKQSGIKDYERQVAKEVLDTLGNHFNYNEFKNAVNIQVVPLTVQEGYKDENDIKQDMYAGYGLPHIGISNTTNHINGDKVSVVKLVFNDTVFNTLAENQFSHYQPNVYEKGSDDNLFGHFRYFVKDNKFYISEIQSDAYQDKILQSNVNLPIGEIGKSPDALLKKYKLNPQFEFYNKFYNRRIFNEAVAYAKSRGYKEVYLPSESTVSKIEWNRDITESQKKIGTKLYKLYDEVENLNHPNIIVGIYGGDMQVVPKQSFEKINSLKDYIYNINKRTPLLNNSIKLGHVANYIINNFDLETTEFDEVTFKAALRHYLQDNDFNKLKTVLLHREIEVLPLPEDAIVTSNSQQDTKLLSLLKNVYTDLIKAHKQDLQPIEQEFNHISSSWYKVNTNSQKFDNILLYQNAKAAYDKLTNTIYALTNPDVTSPLHELAHSWEPLLNDEEKQTVLDWAKTPEWTRETSEKFANGFELYLAEGNAPTTALEAIFKQFAKWLGDVIKKVQTLFGKDFALNNEMRTIYANMLNAKLVKEKVEGVIKTEQLTANNIHFEEQEDGSSKVFVKDNNGNVIKNPNTEDGSFKLQEAKDFIKEYNKKFEPSKTEQPIEETIPVEEVKQSEEQKGPEILKPLNENGKTDYGKISQIQKDIQNGFYEQQLRNKTLTSEQVKAILKSAGLSETVVDGMMFKINNPDLIKSLKEGVPTGINITYLRSDLNNAIKDGRFGEAIRNGEISVEKAKEILKYFNKSFDAFKDDFEAAEQKQAEAIAPTEETAPLNDKELKFINTLKENLSDLKTIYGNVIRDMIDLEDYRGVINLLHSHLKADTKSAKDIFNNTEVYKQFLDLVGLKEGDTQVAEVQAQHPDIFEKETQEEQPVKEQKYVHYKEPINGKIETLIGKVVEDNGFTTLIESPSGEQFSRVTTTLSPATKAEFDALAPQEIHDTSIDNAQYNPGDRVVYGQNMDVFTIVEAKTIETDKGAKQIYYTTEEGPVISESGIRELARPTKAEQIIHVAKQHEKRKNILENIAKRFVQLFPDIKYLIGDFDFNAPARFNKGIVEINTAYNDKRYTRAEINALEFEDPLNVPWLKRETVAHEFMHPFILALKLSNTVLYNNLIKELNKTQPAIIKHVDDLIKSGTYSEENRNDEGLAIYLGKNITEAFTKYGDLDPDFVANSKKRLIKRFIDWLNDIIDFLRGKRKALTLEQFVKNANSDKDAQRDTIRNLVKQIPALQELYSTVHNSDLIKTINYVKRLMGDAYNKDGTINEENFNSGLKRVIDDLQSSQQQKVEKAANLKATIHERPEMENPVYKVVVNGVNRFIQRQETNEADQWMEVVKRKDQWEAPNGKTGIEEDGFLGFTKAEALEALSHEIKPSTEIDIKKLEQLADIISNFIQQKSTGRFEFIIQENDNTDVQFDESDLDHIKVYIDPSFSNDIAAPSTLIRYGLRDLKDNEAAEEFQNLVQRNYYMSSDFKDKGGSIDVDSLNPFMKLQDISDFMVKQLNDKEYTIKYSTAELNAIDELEAYMELAETEAAKIRKGILKRLNVLRDTANVRLNNSRLKTEYSAIKDMDLDSNDEEFVLNYIERAGMSINLAWRKYNELREDLSDPTLSKAGLNRLNKELDVIKQLTSFYDDFSKLYNKYSESFTDDDIQSFRKSTANWQRLRDSLRETSIQLAVKWMMPYAEKHNEYIKQQGYTDPKYFVTEQTLYNNFKYGADKDTNFVTYNLGANVTSRDPVNAIFANMVADMLSINNIDIVNNSFDINEGYAQFLKDHNISNNNSKAQVEYYKQHYLHEVEILEQRYNEKTGLYEDEYVKKLALHQEYNFDKYHKDLTEERKKYENPRNSEEALLFSEKLNKWQFDNNYGQSEKYRNKDYVALQNDKFFKLLEKHYNESNEKYGENKLPYGIIPQKYNVSVLDRLLRIKEAAQSKEGLNKVIEKAELHLAGIRKDHTQQNLDGSILRVVRSELTNLKDDKNIDLNLHNSIIDMVAEATNYSSLKEVQYNVENLRTLIDGNYKFSIPGRNIATDDFERNIRSRQQYYKAKRDIKVLNKLREAGQPYDEDEYNRLQAIIDKGIVKTKLWDKLAGTLKPSQTAHLNEQLIQFINDTFYGESVEEEKLGRVSLNKAAHYLSMYTSINNMAFNTVAGVSNIVIGDVQMVIEAHGGKYFTKKDLAWATKDYYANMGNYISDLQNPIKSKDTQLSFILDAIQGEVQDEFGTRISGNIARRMFNVGSLFFFTSVGEHQIQTIGMKAMLKAKKVKTHDNKTISLYDAYVKDEKGRYSLRKDIDFSPEDLQHFIRELHGVNRALNGNYSDLHKSVLQRKWYGTLALKFRKYIYEAFRTRYSDEHVDFEKNTVEQGYLNFFFKDYLYKNFREMPWNRKFGFITNFKNLNNNQKYAARKAIMELGIFVGALVLTIAFFGNPDDDKKLELSPAQKALLLFSLRLQNDLGMFHVQLPSEFVRQTKSPTASLTSIVAFSNFLGQLSKPTEVYQQSGNGHEAGDSKLAAKFKKMLPVISKFPIDLDGKLGYFNLVNQNIAGVSPKQSN